MEDNDICWCKACAETKALIMHMIKTAQLCNFMIYLFVWKIITKRIVWFYKLL